MNEIDEEAYMNAINTIAKHTVQIAAIDADGDEEEFEFILEDYKMSEAQFIDDAYTEAVTQWGL